MTIFVFILLCLIWGSTWIAIKIGLTDAPPLYAAGIRFIIASSILYSIVAIRRLKLPSTFTAFIRLGYPGLYMFGVSYALVYFSELYISSALTAVLFASFPLFVAGLSTWMLPAERLKLIGWIGLTLGVIGIVIISYESLQTSEDIFLGTMVALAGSLTAAYGLLIHKKNSINENIFVATSVQMTMGGIPLLLMAFLLEDFDRFSFTLSTIGSISYLAVIGSVLAFVTYFWLLKRIKAVNASLIAFVTPVVAIFIGVLFFSETLSITVIIGTLFILFGILLVSRSKA